MLQEKKLKVIDDDEAEHFRPKYMLKGLVDLLARCTVMQLQRDSKVYFLLRDDGQWFISTEFFPGNVVVRECELSDEGLRLALHPVLQLEGGQFDGC